MLWLRAQHAATRPGEAPPLSLSLFSVRSNGMPTVSFPRCFAEGCPDTRPGAFSFRIIVENLFIPQAFIEHQLCARALVSKPDTVS